MGKTFVILTLRNITVKIEDKNSSVLCSAPTGCAASIIHGKTNTQSCNLPMKNQFRQEPSASTNLSTQQVKYFRQIMSDIITRVFGEHSMNGRAT